MNLYIVEVFYFDNICKEMSLINLRLFKKNNVNKNKNIIYYYFSVNEDMKIDLFWQANWLYTDFSFWSKLFQYSF